MEIFKRVPEGQQSNPGISPQATITTATTTTKRTTVAAAMAAAAAAAAAVLERIWQYGNLIW
jgi:hypothetical protein